MDPKEIEPHLIIPFFDYILCCLPVSIRRLLWCGVRHNEDKDLDDDHDYVCINHKEYYIFRERPYCYQFM